MSVDMNWKGAAAVCVLLVVLGICVYVVVSGDPALTEYASRTATLEKLDRIIELLSQIKERTP